MPFKIENYLQIFSLLYISSSNYIHAQEKKVLPVGRLSKENKLQVMKQYFRGEKKCSYLSRRQTPPTAEKTLASLMSLLVIYILHHDLKCVTLI